MKNRKKIGFVALLATIVAAGAGAQAIDKPAATVNYTRPEIITVKQLEQQIVLYQALQRQGAAGISSDPMKVLDDLINEMLIVQAAEQARITVTDNEINAQINRFRAQLSQQQGAPISDQLFQQYLTQQGYTTDTYRAQIKKRIEEEKYVRSAKASLFANAHQPTEQEIRNWYRRNATLLVNPEYVRLSQIFIDTRNLTPDQKKKAADRAQSILRSLKNGDATFAQLVQQYSDDTRSRYADPPGDVGFIAGNAPQEQTYGTPFFNAIFSLKVGQTSDVIESNIGYHIVRITDHRDPKVPKLDEPLGPGDTPQQKMLVRDYIRALMMQTIDAQVLQQATAQLAAELRQKAEVKIFQENIPQ